MPNNDNRELEKTPSAKTPKQKEPNLLQKAVNRTNRWFREMRSELRKVVWPTRKQTINNSIIAAIVIVVSGIFIWAFDQVALLVVQTLISIGK